MGEIELGVVDAFTTNAAKQIQKPEAKITGYQYDHTKPGGQKREANEVDCNPFSGKICKNQNQSCKSSTKSGH